MHTHAIKLKVELASGSLGQAATSQKNSNDLLYFEANSNQSKDICIFSIYKRERKHYICIISGHHVYCLMKCLTN